MRLTLVICISALTGIANLPAIEVPAIRADLFWRVDAAEPAGGYWVFKRLPAPEDVIVPDDAELNAALQNAVKALGSADEDNPREWELANGGQRFRAALKRHLRAFPNFNVVPPPKGAADAGILVVGISYERRMAPVVRKPIEISVIVRGSSAIGQSPVRTTIGELAAEDDAKLSGLTPEERRVPVFVGATDAARNGAERSARTPDHKLAFETALAAFESAKKNDLSRTQPRALALATGARYGADEAVISDIRAHVHAQYELSGSWEVVPADEGGRLPVETDGLTAPWKIRIALQAVEDVTFYIRGSRFEDHVVSLEAHPRWRKDIAAIEARVQRHHGTRFDQLRGRLLTSEEFSKVTQEIQQELEREAKIVSAAVDTAPRSIVFTGFFQPRVTELQASGGYSTDKQLQGTLALTSRNLLVDESLLKLSLNAGLEKREGEFSFALPYPLSADKRTSSSLDVNASYGKDDDLKLGAADAGGFDEEQFRITLRNTFRFTRESFLTEAADSPAEPQAPRPGRAFSTVLAAAVGLSDTRLDAPEERRAEVESGQVLYLLLDLQQSWRSTLRPRDEPGFGETRLFSNVRAKKGIEAGLADFDFFSGTAQVHGRFYFGAKTSRDFLLQLTAGGALVTGNAPVFEEFRLGGESIVRGLEEGERIARGAVYETAQFGVSLARLWTQGGSRALGVDLSTVYLNVFFDHAYVARRGSRNPQHGATRSLEAIGASIEVALPSETVLGALELGYAWSPDSIHDNGRVFTHVRLDF